MIYVLDACAIIAYVRAETGGNLVRDMLLSSSHTCYAHAINILEVYYDFTRQHSEQVAQAVIREVEDAGLIVRRDMERDFLQSVGRIKAMGRISIADCFCLGLAQAVGGEAVTSDRHEFEPFVERNIAPIYFIR